MIRRFAVTDPLSGQSSSGIPYNDTCMNTSSGSCRGTIGEKAEVPSQSGAVVGPASGYFCQSRFGPEWTYQSDEDYDWGSLDIGKICMRTSNTASVSDCCLNNSTGKLSCPPNTDITNPSACNASYASFCGQSANIYTDSRCVKWAQMYPSAAAPVMAAAVAANPTAALANATMRAWCVSSGQCDTAANTYCATASADTSFCSCLHSTQLRPECFDVACGNGGYKSQSMLTGPACGTLVQCVQNAIKTSGTNNTVANNQQIQNCMVNTNGGGTPTVSSSAPAAPVPSTPSVIYSYLPVWLGGTPAATVTPATDTPTADAAMAANNAAAAATQAAADAQYEMYGLMGLIGLVVIIIVAIGIYSNRSAAAPMYPMYPMPMYPGSYGPR